MIRTGEQIASPLNELCAAQPFETGWYFKDLRGGASADRRGDVIVPLSGSGAGIFRGETAAAAGQWDLVIELSRDGERLFRSRNRVWLR